MAETPKASDFRHSGTNSIYFKRLSLSDYNFVSTLTGFDAVLITDLIRGYDFNRDRARP
jgi:hypothetical protein